MNGKSNALVAKIVKQKYLLLMVLPGVIFMIIFNIYPIYWTQIAFKQYNVVFGSNLSLAPWVGFQHFREFFTSLDFKNIMTNTLGISLLKILFGFPIPIIFALMLNELMNLRFRKIVQTITYLPHFLSWVILGGIIITWLNDTGLFVKLLVHLHIMNSPSNILNPPENFWSISVITDIWKEFGWNSIIYIAAISNIDQEMFEAARVDGAGKLRQIFSITLPSIMPTIVVMLILTVSYVLSANFDQIFILKNAVNINRSDIIDTYVYNVSFHDYRFDYATAVGLFKSVVSTLFLFITNIICRKTTGESLF